MGKLTPAEAEQLGAGIAETWKVLASMLIEAVEQEAWVLAGYDRPADWLGDLPALMDIAGNSPLERLPLAVEVPVPAAKKAAAARVSRPGKSRDTSIGRRDVIPNWKAGMR